MRNSVKPVARKEGLVIQEASDEVLVYDLATNKAHCLNNSAAAVWKACDGLNSVEEIVRIVESGAGAPVSDEFVWLAIDQLSEKNLLESVPEGMTGKQSRREVIRKIGLATAVALPIVASLASPLGAMASTSCACNVDADCLAQPGCGDVCVSGACTSST